MTKQKLFLWMCLLILLTTPVLAQVKTEKIQQTMLASFVARYNYALANVDTTRHELLLGHDNTALSRFTLSATQKIRRVEFSLYKLQKEPISKYILPRRVYQYMTFDSKELDNSNIAYAEVEFYVPESWLHSNSVRAEQLIMFTYDEDASKWVEQDTILKKHENSKQYYTVTLSHGIGNFAIGILEPYEIEERRLANRQKVASEKKNATNKSLVPVSPAETEDNQPSFEMPLVTESQNNNIGMIFYAIIAGVAFLAICMTMLFYFMQNKKESGNQVYSDLHVIKDNMKRLKRDINHKSYFSGTVLKADHILKRLEEHLTTGDKNTEKSAIHATKVLQKEVNNLTPKVLKRFVEYQKNQGLTDNQIEDVLANVGFSSDDIKRVSG
jgi:PGF-pre-PGF domain-containing protein